MGASQDVKGEKDADANKNKHINLQVLQDGNTVAVHFKIKKNTALKKLMNAYCDRANLQRNAIKFLHEGRPVQESDTPLGLDMEEGDTIEVFKEQLGG